MSLTALQPPAAPVTSKPRLGFLGLGWIGRARLASIAEAGCAEIAAYADPAVTSIEGAAQAGTLEELLEMDLDGIVIATPSAQHAAQAVAALEGGRAVFCQKPLGRNAAETRLVIDAARAADRLLGVDLSYRHTAALQAIRSVVRSGELGAIFAADLVFHNAYGPQQPWFYDPAQSGGGCVLDLGIHLIDAALWILDSPVARVSSRLFAKGRRLRGRDAAAEDYGAARLDLESGAALGLQCSWHLHAGCEAVIGLAFHGALGGVAMHNVGGSFYDFRAERFAGANRESLTEPPDAWGGRAAVQWAHQLAAGARFDPAVERLNRVAVALDAIYEKAGDE